MRLQPYCKNFVNNDFKPIELISLTHSLLEKKPPDRRNLEKALNFSAPLLEVWAEKTLKVFSLYLRLTEKIKQEQGNNKNKPNRNSIQKKERVAVWN